MKNLIVILLLCIVIPSCKNETSNEKKDKESTGKVETTVTKAKTYPTNIKAVLKAHGGLSSWNTMNNLCFSLDGRGGEEVHTIALKSRKEKIEHKNWAIGNDGKGVWLLQNEAEAYKGNAQFYNQLMFYFYAMPFVLADDGIVYTEMPIAELNGNLYNVVKIGYNDGIGFSPKDEYKIYINPKTNQMEWLGYTVTGSSGKKSDRWSFIKYDTWKDVNGLVLPEKLTWYNVENNLPTTERNDMLFKKVTVTETQIEDAVFAKPPIAEYVK